MFDLDCGVGSVPSAYTPPAPGPVLAIAGTPSTSATVGTAYSAAVTASGGTAPYSFAIASGALPAGVALNAATGAISGTPTTAATYAGIVVRVTDSLGATANLPSFAITVAAAANAPDVTISNLTVTTATTPQTVGMFSLTNAPAGAYIALANEDAGFAIVGS